MSSSLGRRRARALREEERRLWEQVAASVTPLDRGRPEPAAPDPAAEPAVPPPAEAAPPPPPPPPPRAKRAAPPPEPEAAPGPAPTRRALAGWMRAAAARHRADPEAVVTPRPPALAPLDDRTRRRLVRGALPIDERLDLHGLTQDTAHAALRRFLFRARERGARLVLVITGKGKPGGSAFAHHERGVLRRSVPHWLGDPSLRDLVVGFEEAHLAHGGSGAIYVRLRRRRDLEEGDR